MKTNYVNIAVCCFACVGCSHQTVAKGPIKGTVNLEGLTPDQQIAKIQADHSIPDRYKQLYITSVRSKAGQQPGATTQ